MSVISVLIPVYNARKEIRSCLDSVLGQTLRNIEVICINDGSTDGSREVIEEYAKKDSRIKVFSQENVGAGPTRNRGISIATGKYVAFMDADDMYPSNDVLQKMYEVAEASGVNICGGEWAEINSNGKIVREFSNEYYGYTFEKEGRVLYKDYQYDYGYHRFIYKRSFLLDNGIMFPSYLRYQDPPFMIKAMTIAKEFYAIKTPTYLYRSGNKRIDWNAERVCDMLQGMIKCLYYANEYEYRRIQYLIYKRITVNYRKQISEILRSSDKERLILLLKNAGNLVNYSLLEQEYDVGDENKIFALIDNECHNPSNKKFIRGILYLKRNGLKNTIKKIKSHFRKK